MHSILKAHFNKSNHVKPWAAHATNLHFSCRNTVQRADLWLPVPGQCSEQNSPSDTAAQYAVGHKTLKMLQKVSLKHTDLCLLASLLAGNLSSGEVGTWLQPCCKKGKQNCAHKVSNGFRNKITTGQDEHRYRRSCLHVYFLDYDKPKNVQAC